MRPVVVLGATGFLGSHVCEALSRNNPDGSAWVGVSRRPSERRVMTRGGCWYRLDLVAAPVAEYARLLTDVRPSVVINCAGASFGSNAHLRAANVHVTAKLLSALPQSRSTRLVQLGSAAEYGPQPTDAPVTEFCDLRPASPYGLTKLAATRHVEAAIVDGRVEGTVLRVFNAVGARAPETSLAGRAARVMRQAMAQSRSSITLGSLHVHRDFIAAEDVATAVALTARTPGLPPIMNVGRGVAMSSAALVTLLQDVAGYDGEILESDRGSPRSAWVPWQRADISRLQRHLDWTPSTPMASAVAAVWAATA